MSARQSGIGFLDFNGLACTALGPILDLSGRSDRIGYRSLRSERDGCRLHGGDTSPEARDDATETRQNYCKLDGRVCGQVSTLMLSWIPARPRISR